jgi:excisionase family DNA binding protein
MCSPEAAKKICRDKEKTKMAADWQKKENRAQVPLRWMRVAEAAQYLRVSVTFLNRARYTKIPNIPFTRIGGRILYDRLALDAFLQGLEQS